MPARRQAPTTAAAGHAQRCHTNGPRRGYQARGIAAADGANQPDEQPRQRPRR
jgi:hypothetical protein